MGLLILINVSKTQQKVDPKKEDPKSLGFVCFGDFLTDWDSHGMKITIMVTTLWEKMSNDLHQIQVNQLPNGSRRERKSVGWVDGCKIQKGWFFVTFTSRKVFGNQDKTHSPIIRRFNIIFTTANSIEFQLRWEFVGFPGVNITFTTGETLYPLLHPTDLMRPSWKLLMPGKRHGGRRFEWSKPVGYTVDGSEIPRPTTWDGAKTRHK